MKPGRAGNPKTDPCAQRAMAPRRRFNNGRYSLTGQKTCQSDPGAETGARAPRTRPGKVPRAAGVTVHWGHRRGYRVTQWGDISDTPDPSAERSGAAKRRVGVLRARRPRSQNVNRCLGRRDMSPLHHRSFRRRAGAERVRRPSHWQDPIGPSAINPDSGHGSCLYRQHRKPSGVA